MTTKRRSRASAARTGVLGGAGQVAGIVGIVVAIVLIVGALLGRGWAIDTVNSVATRLDSALDRAIPPISTASGLVGEVADRVSADADKAEEIAANPGPADSQLLRTSRRRSRASRTGTSRCGRRCRRPGQAVSVIERVRDPGTAGCVPGIDLPAGRSDKLSELDSRIQDWTRPSWTSSATVDLERRGPGRDRRRQKRTRGPGEARRRVRPARRRSPDLQALQTTSAPRRPPEHEDYDHPGRRSSPSSCSCARARPRHPVPRLPPSVARRRGLGAAGATLRRCPPGTLGPGSHPDGGLDPAPSPAPAPAAAPAPAPAAAPAPAPAAPAPAPADDDAAKPWRRPTTPDHRPALGRRPAGS